MDRSHVINLIGTVYTQDALGQAVATSASYPVYCNLTSVTANEFFSAGQNGINAEYRATMFAYDYHDEELVEIGSKQYKVYRVYRRQDDMIELYLSPLTGRNVHVLPTPQ